MQQEGLFREMKKRRYYEKPSARRKRKQKESLQRERKRQRKLGRLD
ncbi:30S ribosomal protein S21 [uncultured Desulfuromonas sp.]|nr:30S ribosomal protein S21 [uncultured Desulfuromonas sp.]